MGTSMTLSAKLQSFVDYESGNWRRVAVNFTEQRNASLDDALAALELVKKAFYTPSLLDADEVENLEALYQRIRKAYPELGLS